MSEVSHGWGVGMAHVAIIVVYHIVFVVLLILRLPISPLWLVSSGAAWHLSRCEGIQVTVLEARERAGGHANTIDLELPEGEVSVDTGCVIHG